MLATIKQFLSTSVILCLVIITVNNARANNTKANSDAKSEANHSIIKSQYDHKDYLTFTLANKLEVLVISDPKSDVAAASLVVTAGQRTAPENYLGLPHLLEHAVFLGSKNYPDPSEFDLFIKQHNGWSNGSTRTDNTHYHFQIDHQALNEGLNRLADFITAPLLEEHSIEKARTAVDNEFHGRTSDWRKTLAILRQETNPIHPSAKFGGGNAQSLKGDLPSLKKELFDFHQHYYGAQNSKLVVYGKESVTQLKTMVTNHFTQIKESDRFDQKPTVPRHLPTQLANQIELNIQSNLTSLDIRFEVPAHNNIDAKSAGTLASYLLGHEAEGSLYAYLKSQGLISRLQATPEGNRYYGILTLYIQLTDKGLANKDNVIESVFAYIDLLKTQPLPPWISQDITLAAKRTFDFPPEQEPGDWLSTVSYDMLLYPQNNWLNHNTVISTKNFARYLENLTPDNMQLVVSHKETKANKNEAIYNTPYRTAPFNEAQLSLWHKVKSNKAMHYPVKNPYFTTTSAVNKKVKATIVNDQEMAELSINVKGLSLWTQQKTDISTDKISTKIRLFDDIGVSNNLIRTVHSKAIQEHLFDTSYFATLAGFDFTIKHFSSGYTLEVNGYSDNYFDFLQRVIKLVIQYVPSEELFAIAKQEVLHDIDYQQNYSRPYQQVQKAIHQTFLNEEGDGGIENQLENLSYQQYLSVIQANDKRQLSGVITGNISNNLTNNKLSSFADELRITFDKQLSANLKQSPKVKQLPIGLQTKHVMIDHSDASIAFAIQAHDESINSQANFLLINSMLQRKYYHHIRTNKSLAYFVHMRQLPTYNTANIVMVAQSGNSSTEQLTQATTEFLNSYAQTLKTMSESDFQQLLDDAIDKVNAPNYALSHYTRDLEQALYASKFSTFPVTSALSKQTTPFDKKQKIITELQSQTKEEFVKFYHQQIIGNTSKRLLIFTSGKTATKSKNE